MYQDYPDLHIFVPFAQNMTRPNPNDRPTITQALMEFEGVVSLINRRTLRTQIWRHEDTLSERLFRFVNRIPAL